MLLKRLIETITKNDPKADINLIERAYEFANIAHAGQKRATGEDYINHPLETAQNLAEMKLPAPIIAAGLLHDVPEDTNVTLDEIKKEFGDDIAKMVGGITKLGRIKYRGAERYVENLRKMFVAMAEDIRVILIKFADRLNNLQSLYIHPANKAKRIAVETLEIYAPIANRLGMAELQGRLEDAAFKYALPEQFKEIEEIVKQNLPQKKTSLNNMMKKLKQRLDKDHVKYYDVYGRTKHLYSFYKKYLKYNKDLNQIYDLLAMRVIVPEVADCYMVLGIIHGLWRPIRGRVKDFIAQPKPNGYQSLHTTVFGDNQEITEIQIRTEAMDEIANYGIANHWGYKEHKDIHSKEIAWVEDLADWLKKNKELTADFLESAKIDVFQDHIFAFTPAGDVIDLPEGATPIDFAYHVHTDMGNQFTGASVNNEKVKPDYQLKNGDVVKIITDKNRKGPDPKWIEFVKTRAAAHQINLHKRKGWTKIIPRFGKN